MKPWSLQIPRIQPAKGRRPAVGAIPGTLAHRTELPPPIISRVRYNRHEIEIDTFPSTEIDKALEAAPEHVVWLDVSGLGDASVIQRIGDALQLHPLTIEDIAHTHQRPKLEELDECLFVALRAIRVDDSGNVDNEQISILLFDRLLVTFQERPGDGFDPVRKRLREGQGQIRRQGPNYLFYALLDVTIDDYFPVIDLYDEAMESLDEQIRLNPTAELSRAVHHLRRELRQLRRAIWPLRDVAGALGRTEIERLDKSLQPAFRDCYDHVIQVADFVESSRERAADLGDLYQTMVGERTNQVMKTLTIVATIFIPLTFLCGLYGMNFDPRVSPYNMPELEWRYGYLALWGVMLTMVTGMLWFFRRKGWLGGPGDHEGESAEDD
jgi:magnesium transporter